MFSIDTKTVKSYVEAPPSLLKRRSTYIALIADGGNHFLAYGIIKGTTLFVDLETEYEEGKLSCLIDKQVFFKLSKTELDGYKYVGRVVAACNDYEV